MMRFQIISRNASHFKSASWFISLYFWASGLELSIAFDICMPNMKNKFAEKEIIIDYK